MWFSLGIITSSTNKTNYLCKPEILLKVGLKIHHLSNLLIYAESGVKTQKNQNPIY